MLRMGRRGGVIGRRYVAGGTSPGPTPTRYLDNSHPSASDSNPGTSAALPKATIAGINSVTLVAGDVVGIKRGTSYSGTPLSISEDGTSSQPITVTAYGTGALPTISTPSSNWGVQMVGANWVIVERIAVINSIRGSVSTDSASANITFRYMEMTNGGMGCEFFGGNTYVHHCYIHDTKMVVATPDTGGGTGDDDFGAVACQYDNCSNHEFAFNLVLRCKAPSPDYGNDGGCIETWQSCSNILVHDNWVQLCNSAIECGASSATHVVTGVQVYNNVFWNNGHVHHLHNGTGTQFGVTIGTLSFTRNTVVEPTANSAVFSYNVVPTSGFTYSRNILYVPNLGGNNLRFPNHTMHDNNYNHVSSNVTGGTSEVNGTTSFVNFAGGDFHPTSGHASEAYGAYSNGGLPTSANPTLEEAPSGTRNVVPSTKNKFRNSDWYGAAVGTWPENISTITLRPTMTASVTAIGTATVDAQTVPYIDVRFQASAATAGNAHIALDVPNIPIVAGQVWTMSGYIALVGGTATNTTLSNAFCEMLDGSGNWLSGAYATMQPLASATLARVTSAATTAPANTANGQVGIILGCAAGAIDCTVRYAGFQIEQASAVTALLRTSSNNVL